jgi:hypothetical protein
LLDPGGRAQKSAEARDYAAELGVSFELEPPEDTRKLAPEVSTALSDPTSRAQIVAALRRTGLTGVTTDNVEDILSAGTRYNADDVVTAAQNSRAFAQVRQQAQGQPGLSGATRDAVERAALDLYKNRQSRLRDVLSGFRELNDGASGDMAQALRGRVRDSVGAIKAAAQRDQANRGDAVSSLEATGRAIVATMPEVFERKSYDEVVSDSRLANTLGKYVQAYSAETGDKSAQQVLDAAGDNGEASTNEQLTKYLGSLKEEGGRAAYGKNIGIFGGTAVGTFAGLAGQNIARTMIGGGVRMVAGLAGRMLGTTLGGIGGTFMAGPLGTAIGAGVGLAAGAAAGAAVGNFLGSGVDSMFSQPNESFSAVVDDDKGKAGGRLTAGINEALLRMIEEGGNHMSYDDLVARAKDATGFDDAATERMLSEAGLYRGSFAQDRDALREQMGKVSANASGGNGKGGDAKALALMNDARKDPRAFLKVMYNARRSINNYLNASGYRLDEAQQSNLEVLRGKGVDVTALRRQLEGTDIEGLKRAADTLISTETGSKQNAISVRQLLDRVNQDPTEEDAQTAADLGLASYGAKGVTSANRKQMLAAQLVHGAFGGPSLEKATAAVGAAQSTQQLAGVQESIKKQTEVANSLAELSKQLGQDNDFIKTALKGVVGKSSDSANDETLHGFAKRFGDAVDKFANTQSTAPARPGTGAKQPLPAGNVPTPPAGGKP